MQEFLTWLLFAGATAWRRKQWAAFDKNPHSLHEKRDFIVSMQATSADYWQFWKDIRCPKMLDYRFRA